MEPEATVACKFCGQPTTYTGTKMCNGCYEVSSRIDKFIASKEGFKHVLCLILGKMGRIRVVGSARQTAFNHGGIEFWTSNPYPEHSEQVAQETAIAIEQIASLMTDVTKIESSYANGSKSFMIKLNHCAAIADVSWMGMKTLYFNRINVPAGYRGAGYGTALLKQVLEFVDQNKAVLLCEINPSGKMTKDQLEAWYKRHGFVWSDEFNSLVYDRRD